MSEAVPDEFVTDEMDDGEEVHRYRPGGLPTLVIYWTAKDTVVHKLGQGASSTVWLARDLSGKTSGPLKPFRETGLDAECHSRVANRASRLEENAGQNRCKKARVQFFLPSCQRRLHLLVGHAFVL